MKEITWNGERISKFVLGTAQLGMNYGIANARGQPSEASAREIVEAALSCGVNCLDTAQAYGNSEVVLGKILKNCESKPYIKIVSKLSPDLQITDDEIIEKSIKSSCQNLCIEQLWCLMLHRADLLDLWDKKFNQVLNNIKEKGIVKHLGVSVYSLNDAYRALENHDIQVIQLPCNLWDQRALRSGIFEQVKKKNKLCFIRSIYLQGLLLLSPEEVIKKLPAAEKASRKWHELATKFVMKPEQLSIRFGLSLNAPLVIGAESMRQVEENVQFCEQASLPADITEQIWSEMSPLLNDDILNPILWGKQKQAKY